MGDSIIKKKSVSSRISFEDPSSIPTEKDPGLPKKEFQKEP